MQDEVVEAVEPVGRRRVAEARVLGSDEVDRLGHPLVERQPFRHLVVYPLEFLGCTAPWSLLSGAFLSKRFRRKIGAARGPAVFLALYCAVGFLPCWAPPGAMTRYVYPLFPAVALLAGLVADRASYVALSPRLRHCLS